MTEKSELWLRLLKAETEEDLTAIEEQGIPEVTCPHHLTSDDV